MAEDAPADAAPAVEAPPELSLEQQQALALARARRRRQQQPPSGDGGIGRQLGLTARAAGPTAAGAVLGGAMGSVLPGVGTVGGAGVGALAMNLVHLMDRLGGTNHMDKLMDTLGLPKPANKSEEMAQAVTESMANMAGSLGAAQNFAKTLTGPAKEVAEQVASSPGLGITSAATGAGAQEATRQAGGGPTAQFVANVAGSALPVVAAPAAVNIGRGAKRLAGDTVAAARAAFGHKPSIEKLAADAIEKVVGENAPEVLDALKSGTTLVPGAKPTVAEAIAEQNLKNPERQMGGALVKLQDELSGAKGAEDILPSKMKANQAAIDAHISNTESEAAKLRNMAFESARRTEGPNTLGPRIDLTLLKDNAQLRNNRVAIRAIDDLNKQLVRSADKRGYVDPETLYSIRQNSRQLINSYIEKGLSKDHAAYILGQFNKGIDKAMVDGGAVGWKAYLETYSKGMAAAEQHTARLKEAESIAQGIGAQSPGEMVRGELPHLPTLLHRPTMFANFMLKLIAKDATTPVMREMATRMQDPEQFAQLMKRPDGTPAKAAVNDVLLHAAILANLVQKHQADQQEQK